MQPLTDLSGTPQLSEDERWMEVARIAFPKQRNEQEVIAEQQRFVDRFQGSRSERYVYLSKIFGRRSTLQNFKDYLRTGELLQDFFPSWGYLFFKEKPIWKNVKMVFES